MRILAMLAAVLALAANLSSPRSAFAEDRPAGLMWNRTGLPAVFPLQVRSDPGSDYMVTLVDAETQEPALAAYITGGAFFRVLVPPGTFVVKFATGAVWRGDEEQFGPGDSTRRFDLPKPLTFGTKGMGTKAGHIVDITGQGEGRLARLEVDAQSICQRVATVRPPEWERRTTSAVEGFFAADPALRRDTMVDPVDPDRLDDLLNRPTAVYEWTFASARLRVLSRYC